MNRNRKGTVARAVCVGEVACGGLSAPLLPCYLALDRTAPLRVASIARAFPSAAPDRWCENMKILRFFSVIPTSKATGGQVQRVHLVPVGHARRNHSRIERCYQERWQRAAPPQSTRVRSSEGAIAMTIVQESAGRSFSRMATEKPGVAWYHPECHLALQVQWLA